MDNLFINEFLTYGISNYLLLKDTSNFDKSHIFEVYIISCLNKIYGESTIINSFKTKNEYAFKSNIIMYGYTVKEMENFLGLLDSYTNWLNSEKNVGKTEITSKIELCLINMIIEKNKNKKLEPDEKKFYESFFDPTNNDLSNLHNLITKDINIVPIYWNRKKTLFDVSVEKELIRTDLLSSSIYDKYGLEKDEVKKMSNEKIKNINNKIIEKEKNEETKKKFIPKILITSGNGFVDTLMLLCIMTTEIIIGIIIALNFLRG